MILRCWQGYPATGTLIHCWQECRLVQLWKTVFHPLIKSEQVHTLQPSNLLLSMCSRAWLSKYSPQASSSAFPRNLLEMHVLHPSLHAWLTGTIEAKVSHDVQNKTHSIHSKGQFHPGPKSYRHSRSPSLFSHSSWNPSSKFCQLFLKKIYPESNTLLITSFLPLGQGYHHLSPELLHWTLNGFPAAILTPLVYFQPISPSTAIKILIGLYHSSP